MSIARRLVGLALIAACAEPINVPPEPAASLPRVDSIIPARAFVGQRIRILGTSLGEDPAQVSVSFGASVARPTKANADGTELEVVVPAWAESGDVVVETDAGRGNGVTFTSLGRGAPSEGRVGAVGEVARLTQDFYPMPDGVGFAALMVQPVAGEGQGALGVVTADGRFRRLLDTPVEAMWVGAQASVALVVAYDEAGRVQLTRYSIVDGRLVRERGLELKAPVDLTGESFAISATESGLAAVVGCFSGSWAVTDADGTMSATFSDVGGTSAPHLARLDEGTFLVRRASGFRVVQPGRSGNGSLGSWTPYAQSSDKNHGGAAVAVLEGERGLVALGRDTESGVALFRYVASDGGWELQPAGHLDTPLISGVEALGFSSDGARLAVSGGVDVTVYALETLIDIGGAPVISGSPLANTAQGGVGLFRDVGGIFFAANAGGISAYSTRTGAPVGRMNVSGRIGGLEVVSRTCRGETRDVAEVYSRTFGSVMSVDPFSLAPVRCGTTALVDASRVRASRSVPARDERLVLAERAEGGARIYRQDASARETVVLGTPLDLPAFSFGCPPHLDGDLRCHVSGQLRVSPDGRRLVATWLGEDAADRESVRTYGIVASLEEPWAEGLAPKVFSIQGLANVVDLTADRVTVAGHLGPAGATIMASLDLEAGLRGEVKIVGEPVSIPAGVRGGVPVGDELAPGLFWLVKTQVSGQRNGFFRVEPATLDVTLQPIAGAPGKRLFPSPGRGLVAWIETAWGRSSSEDGRDGRPVWNAVALGPDGKLLRSLPSIELPMPLNANEEQGGVPSVTYTADGARAVVAVPWSDRLARVD